MDDAKVAQVTEKVERLRRELAALGLESSFFYRSPGSTKAPVAFLLIGETQNDVEAARNA
jgi:replication-associated recombination protein RarA